MPTQCPVCSSPVLQDSSNGKASVAFRCTGALRCSAQVVGNIAHAVSRSALDIEGLGETIVEKMYAKRFVTRLSDVFVLNYEQIMRVDGFGEVSAKKLLASIAKAKGVAMHKFIYSLGIANVGENTSKQLSKYFKSVDALLSATESALLGVPDLGPITAQSILDVLGDEQSRAEIERIAQHLCPAPVEEVAGGTFQGKTFVITGTLSKPREHFEAMIESLGGKCSGSVSKKTSYLLSGDAAGSKLDKARELGVVILDEAIFSQMCH
jgi:DNA ligase (NAD+)